MTDVYNTTSFERNDIQSVPDGYIDTAANNLYRFLGSFWTNIHQGEDFVKNLQKVRGIKVAQFYLDLLETLKLQDRRGMPVFHRELWKPLVIRKSQANTSQENLLKLGGDAVIGPQPAGSKYGEGTVLQLGKLANLDKYVTYPVDGTITGITTSLTNNVIHPTVSYQMGTSFPSSDVVYMNGTLIFPIDKDPFNSANGFEIYDVTEDATDDTSYDQEVVLWASDVLIDANYIANHMAYALGITCSSSSIVKRILNAGWDAINCSLTPELLRTLLAAMMNIPVIQETEEKIVAIDTAEDGTKQVRTDKHVYTIYKDAVLRSCVIEGAKLRRGDLLDESVRIYPFLTDVSDAKLQGTTEYADILKTDIPIISVPKALIRANTKNGVYVDWTPTEVLDTGKLDKNNHRKLFFELGGSEEDVDAFWDDVWDYAESRNIDISEYLLNASEDPASSSSDDTWYIVPAKFFLEYFMGANTLIIAFDRHQVEDSSLIRDPMFFNILNGVLSSSTRLFFVEHVDIDEDEYGFTNSGLVEQNTDDEAEKFAFDEVDEEIEYSDLPGIKGKRMPTYEDQVEMKLFRNRKRSAD